MCHNAVRYRTICVSWAAGLTVGRLGACSSAGSSHEAVSWPHQFLTQQVRIIEPTRTTSETSSSVTEAVSVSEL